MKQTLRKAVRFGLYGLILSGVACSSERAGDGSEEAQDETPSVEVNKPTESPGKPSAGSGLSYTEQVNGAIADLAEREQVSKDSIQMTRASEVTWANSALGCPEPGMSYTEALVPGLWVLLTVDGIHFHYHGAAGRALLYCPQERIEPPAYQPSREDVM